MSDKLVLYDEIVGKHYPAPAGFVPDVLSKEPGNYLRLGNDKGIFADGNDILSNQTENALGISAVDGKIYYRGDGGGGGSDEGNVDSVSVNNKAPVLPDTNKNVGLTGIVTGVAFNGGGDTLAPDASGILTLPPYPDAEINSVSVNNKAPVFPDTNKNVGLTGIVTGVTFDNGAVTFVPNVNGVLSLPDYPPVPELELANSSANFLKAVQLELANTASQIVMLALDKSRRYEVFLTASVSPVFASVTINMDSTGIPHIADNEEYYEIELAVTNQVTNGIVLTISDTEIINIPLVLGSQFNLILRKYRFADTKVLDIWRIHGYSNSIYDSRASGIPSYSVIDPLGWLRLYDPANSFSQVIQGFIGYSFISTAATADSGVVQLIRGVHRQPCSFKLRLTNRHTTSSNWPVDVGIVGIDSTAIHTLFSTNISYYTTVEYTINCTFNPSGVEVWTWYQNEIATNTSLADATPLQAGVVKYDGNTITKNASGQLEAASASPDGSTIGFNNNGQLTLIQYNNLQDFGTSTNITLDLTTRTSAVVSPGGNLTVNIAKLANTIDKLSTLVIKATAAISITWVFPNSLIWTSSEDVTILAVGETAIVNIWQQAGGCLLSKIYSGTYNS